jgi:hypothetical protein
LGLSGLTLDTRADGSTDNSNRDAYPWRLNRGREFRVMRTIVAADLHSRLMAAVALAALLAGAALAQGDAAPGSPWRPPISGREDQVTPPRQALPPAPGCAGPDRAACGPGQPAAPRRKAGARKRPR